MKRSASAASGRSSAEVRQAVESFLHSSKQPVLIEPGEPEIPLLADHYSLDSNGSRLSLTAWSDVTRVTRRLSNVRRAEPGRLELDTILFGNRPGTLTLVDAARPQHEHIRRRGESLQFRERLRRFLSRQFAGWRVEDCSTESNLEHTLSPCHPRATIRREREAYAVIAAEVDHAHHVLTFGLLWLDYVRRRDREQHYAGLILLLPVGSETTTRERLAWMNPQQANYRLFVYSADGHEGEVDLHDRGNLASDLPDLSAAVSNANDARSDALVDALSAVDGVEILVERPGKRSLRVQGLEFARQVGSQLHYGVETNALAEASHLPEMTALARQLAGWRTAGGDRQHPLYQRVPERWLEAAVRRELSQLDATLREHPVYGQVPAFAGQDRGLLDLLVVNGSGGLVVLELKATADPHLPLQALDYWMRVRWHWERGHFTARGYFPGVALSQEEPQLLLVAPALEFHPSTEIILSYLAANIPVVRLGLASHWRQRLNVVFRLAGDAHPK